MKGLKIRIADTQAILLKLGQAHDMLSVLQHANRITVPTPSPKSAATGTVVKLIEIPHEIMGDGASGAVLVDRNRPDRG